MFHMKIGIFTVSLFMPGNQNLKEKRAVLNSLKSKLKYNFNIAIIESGSYDKWQKADLSIAALGIKNAAVDTCFCNIVDFLESDGRVELIDYKTEII